MKPRGRNVFFSARLIDAVLWTAFIAPALGIPPTEIYWDGTGSSWNSLGSWSTGAGTTSDPGSLPSTLNVADFSISTVNTAQTVNLDAAPSVAGLNFLSTNTATTTLQGGGTNRTLTLGSSGITVSSGAGAVTIGSATSGQAVNIALGAAQSWTNNSANALTVQTNTTNMAYTLTVGGAGDTAINGYLGGSGGSPLTGGLTKTGSGTLTLSSGGLSFYTGTTTVAQGTLSVALIAGYLGNGGSVTLGSTGNTGTLQYTGSSSADTGRAFTMTGTGAFDITQAAMNMGITNAIDGAGGLSKLGAGTLTLKGASTYAGTTTVSGGTLAYGIADALNNGAVTVNGGTLDIKAYNDSVGAVTLTTGSITGTTGVLTGTSYVFNGTGSASAILAGTGSVTKSGAATTTTLTGTNTFTGVLTLTAGTLSVGTIGNGGAAGNLGQAANTADKLVFDGGTLQYTGSSATSNRAFTINAGKTATIDTANNISFAGATGTTTTGSLTKIGAGALTLTVANTYSGSTTISGGTLALGSAGSFANSTLIDVGTTGSTGTVLDLTVKTSGFHILSGQTLAGIGTVNITGATLTVDSGAHWAPGNSIGINAVTGALTLASGSNSDFQLGNSTGAGTHASPYNSDRSTVTGALNLGGTLNLFDNAGADSNGSVAPGAYLLFTQSGTAGAAFSSIGDVTGFRSKVVTATSGSVFLDNYALAAAASTQTANVGSFHVGVAKTVAVTLNNTAAANATYTETLQSNGFTSTTTHFSAAGSASGIIGGGSGSGTLLVGVDTGLGAGVQSGSSVLAMQSNAVNSSGFGTVSIGNQTITLNATGYNLAATGYSTTSVALGTIHLGASFGTQSLSIDNTLAAGTYNETLGASFANVSGVSTSGGPVTVAAGAAANTSLTVGLANSAGPHSGTVDVQFDSQAVNSSGLGSTALAGLTKTVTVSGNVFNGSGVWSGAGSGWGTSSQWADSNSVHAAPGSFGGYDNVDTATFNGSGATTVNLDATSPSLKTLDLSGASAYTIAQGTGSASLQFKSGSGDASLTAASDGHLISAPVSLASNLTATVTGSSNTLTLSGAISGSGILTKTGAGTLALSGANSYGGTHLDAGTLAIGAAAALGSGTLTFNGGVLDVSSTFTLGNAIVVNDASHGVWVASGQTLTLSGAISGSYGLHKDGTGFLVMGSGSNSAPTIINAGTVTATASNAGSSVSIASGTTLAFDQSGGADTYGGALSGGGNVGVSGALTLSGSNTSFSGNIEIGGSATLTVATPANLGGSSAQIALVGSATGTSVLHFDSAAANTYANDITVSANQGVLHNTGSGTVTLGGTLSKDGSVLVLQGGAFNITGSITGASAHSDLVVDNSTVTLSGVNSYAGPTYIRNAGTLNANSALPTAPRSDLIMDGSGSSSLNLGASQQVASLTGLATSTVALGINTLTIGTASGSTTFAGALSGAGALVKDGAAIQILSGSNSYGGTTTVSAGTLLVNGANTGLGTLTVASTGTLGGTGSIAGAVSVSGTLSPGTSIGSLSTGALTFNTGSSFVYEMDATAVASVAADFQKVFGDVTLTGAVNLDLSATTAFAPNTTLALINYNGAWNGGFFTYAGNPLSDNEQFTAGSNTWTIHYAADEGGANYAGDYVAGHFINLTNSLTAIPEPGSWLALACLLSAGSFIRSRRKSPVAAA